MAVNNISTRQINHAMLAFRGASSLVVLTAYNRQSLKYAVFSSSTHIGTCFSLMKKVHMIQLHCFLASVAGVALLWGNVQADVSEYFGVHLDDKTKAQLVERIQELQSSPEKAASLKERIRHRTVLCKTCHGEDGKSVKPGVPNLAAQNMDYLVDQLIRFRAGTRYDGWMTGLAKGFSNDDIVNIAVKYATMPPVFSGDGDKELIPEGKSVFSEHCTKCHGVDGKGNKGYARLAGQRADYVVKILKGFRERNGRRENPWMTAVSLRLNMEQIKAVASYVSHLK